MLSKSDKEKLVKIAALLTKARKEEVEIDESMEDEFGEKFMSRRPGTDTVNKAIAIAKKMSGNMTGAVKEIEKIRNGLSKYPEVADALRMANEEFELDEAIKYTHAAVDSKGKVIGFASKESDARDMARRNKGRVVTLTKPLAPKKGDMMINRPLPDEMDKFPTNTSATQGKRMEEVELDEAGSQGMFLVIQGLNDNKQKVVSMHKRKVDIH